MAPTTSSERESNNNLPRQLTAFYGRQSELRHVAELLPTASLLTLMGHGGSGKTRLAVEVARRLLADCRDGAWFVDLAPIADPGLIPSALAAVIGIHDDPDRPLDETLVDRLRDRQLLIVLDNCEHLIDGAAHLVAKILQQCAEVKVLATSRRSLHVAGETLFRVPPLSLPAAGGAPTLEDAKASEAVQLFVGRAQSVQPAFELTSATARDVVDICQRLDGLPLAIELAAARLQTIPLSGLMRRLDDRFRLLATDNRGVPGRQRTLEATVEWSYDLLPERMRLLLRRLSVFAGGCDLEAAEEVCGFGDIKTRDVIELLGELVDASLVVLDGGRYRLLESVRGYARSRPESGNEAEVLEQRRATHLAALSDEALLSRGHTDEAAWVRRLELDHDNLRAALGWCAQHDVDAGRRIALAASMMWWVKGNVNEGRRWVDLYLELGAVRDATRGRLAQQAGWFAQSIGDFAAAQDHYTEAIELGLSLEDRLSVATTTARLGSLYRFAGRLAEAQQRCEEAVAAFRRLDEPGWLAWSMVHLAATQAARGDIPGARAVLEEAVKHARIADAPREIELSAATAGLAALVEGDVSAARALAVETLNASQRAGDHADVIYGLELAAALAATNGRHQRAIRLAGAFAAYKQLTGLREDPHFTAYVERLLEPAHKALGAEAESRARDSGRAMSLQEAIDYALQPDEMPDTKTSALTRRELEVAGLVAEGLTARQIGERLFIAERTVESHIERIRNKLGFHSRAQIASWVVQQRWLRN